MNLLENQNPWKLQELGKDKIDWPKISIVTPSLNQAAFLESALTSVLSQQYPNLEYIVIDGGSTDGSQEIIKKYSDHLNYWVSEPDRGMYHAINKGFEHASGDIFGWINSSDILMPWSLWLVGQIFSQIPDLKWLSSLYPVQIGEHGLPIRCEKLPGHNKELFSLGRNHIQQESTFWKRGLWLEAGGLDDRYLFAGDFELWFRFYRYAKLASVNVPLGATRLHGNQKNTDPKYNHERSEIINAGVETHKVSRAVIRKLRLHEIPKIRVLVNSLAGYEMPMIRTRIYGDDLKWELTIEKQFI